MVGDLLQNGKGPGFKSHPRSLSELDDVVVNEEFLDSGGPFSEY